MKNDKTILLNMQCNNPNIENVKILLEKYSDEIDLTYHDGICFKSIIKHNNTTILNMLLQHYHNTKLKCDRYSDEYKKAHHDLHKILQHIVENTENISPEIKEILSPYLSRDEDSDQGDLIEKEDDITASTHIDSNHTSDGEEIGSYQPLRQWMLKDSREELGKDHHLKEYLTGLPEIDSKLDDLQLSGDIHTE